MVDLQVAVERPTARPIQIVATSSATVAKEVQLAVFDEFPAWGIAHAARDNSAAPLVRAGEVVVVESNGQKGIIPEPGRPYLIEYVSPPPSPDYGFERRTREIVQVDERFDGEGNSTWWVHPYRRSRATDRVFVCSDGPYRDQYQIAEKILGPVVGIFRPRMV